MAVRNRDWPCDSHFCRAEHRRGKGSRVDTGVKTALWMSQGYSLLMSFVVYIFRKELIAIFIIDPTTVEAPTFYTTLLLFYILFAVANIYTCAISGLGIPSFYADKHVLLLLSKSRTDTCIYADMAGCPPCCSLPPDFMGSSACRQLFLLSLQ